MIQGELELEQAPARLDAALVGNRLAGRQGAVRPELQLTGTGPLGQRLDGLDELPTDAMAPERGVDDDLGGRQSGRHQELSVPNEPIAFPDQYGQRRVRAVVQLEVLVLADGWDTIVGDNVLDQDVDRVATRPD